MTAHPGREQRHSSILVVGIVYARCRIERVKDQPSRRARRKFRLEGTLPSPRCCIYSIVKILSFSKEFLEHTQFLHQSNELVTALIWKEWGTHINPHWLSSLDFIFLHFVLQLGRRESKHILPTAKKSLAGGIVDRRLQIVSQVAPAVTPELECRT